MTYHGIGGAGYVLSGAQVYSAVVAAAAAGGGFAPTDISGCTLWLDASDVSSLHQDDAGSTPVTADGDPVGYWSNKGTAGDAATQATSGSRPTYKTGIQNGLSVLRLAGSGWMSFPSLQYTNITVFVVADNFQTGATWHTLIGYPQAATHTNPYFRWVITYNLTTSLIQIRWNGSSTDVSPFTPAWGVYALQDRDLYFNGVQILDGGDADLSYANVLPIKIGANAVGGEIWNGDIAEIIIYNSALSTTDRESVESYLATKWGL